MGEMFEKCPIINRMCAYCGYDTQKRLRCGFATHPNLVSELKVCPLKAKKARRKRR